MVVVSMLPHAEIGGNNHREDAPQFIRIPTVKFKISGKAFLKSESRTSVTFKLQTFYIFHNFFMVTYLLSPNRCHWQIAKIKNYNLNVTEVRDSDFKNAFPGIFNFTVGILSSIWASTLRERLYKLQIAKVKNYNFNVTEVRGSDFKNAFPGIFNFTVGILTGIQTLT